MFTVSRYDSRFRPPRPTASTPLDYRRRYADEDAALLRVAEDLAAVSAELRIDPVPVAHRRPSGGITVTADAVGLIYVIRRIA